MLRCFFYGALYLWSISSVLSAMHEHMPMGMALARLREELPPDAFYTLVLGISPEQETHHPLVMAQHPRTLFLSEPTATHPANTFLPPHSFFIDFNSDEFSTMFVMAAQGLFSRVYFDWSTFKFVKLPCLRALYALLPDGGKVVIPTPVSIICEILERGERSIDFWMILPKEERFFRNLAKEMEALERLAFFVQSSKAAQFLGDTILARIMDHARSHPVRHPEEKEFVLVALKSTP